MPNCWHGEDVMLKTSTECKLMLKGVRHVVEVVVVRVANSRGLRLREVEET